MARLDVGETGTADHLRIGDRFVLVGGRDAREHVVTDDHGSHFEYDGRPNKRLSKGELVKRVGTHDPGERKDRVVSTLRTATENIERAGDLSAWMASMTNVTMLAQTYGMEETILPLEKLEKLGTALFSHVRGSGRGRPAIEMLDNRSRKEWNRAKDDTLRSLQDSIVVEASLKQLVREIVRKCGDEWCLYTRHKTNGKRRRLGTHSSKEAAYNQEKAIKANE